MGGGFRAAMITAGLGGRPDGGGGDEWRAAAGGRRADGQSGIVSRTGRVPKQGRQVVTYTHGSHGK